MKKKWNIGGKGERIEDGKVKKKLSEGGGGGLF